MNTITFRLTGVSPLLQNNPAQMGQGQKGVASKDQPYGTKEEQAERTAYRLPSGQLYLTADAIRNSVVKAASGERVKIGRRSEYLTAVLKAGVFLLDEYCPLIDPDTNDPIRDYEIDVRRVVRQKQGILKPRAKLPKWQCDVTFEWQPDVIPDGSVEIVTQMLQRAGQRVGVGDYRVERGGPFGRYTAELVEVHRDG